MLAACAPVVIPAGPALAPPELAADSLVMADGARLPLHAWLPEAPPRAVVLAVHGFGDTARNAFRMAAPLFNAGGVALYAYDQRGFGEAPNWPLWPGAETLETDLAAASRLLRRRYPSLPLYILGESMGGAVAVAAAASKDPPVADGYILVAPALWGLSEMPAWMRGLLEFAAHTIPKVGFRNSAPGITPTDNPEAAAGWRDDPRTYKEVRVDTLYGLVNLMDAAVKAAPEFRARALILYGAHDQIVRAEPVRAALRRLPEGADQRLAYYAQGYHMLLRDRERAVVAGDILAWITNPEAPLPSGADRAAREWLARPGE